MYFYNLSRLNNVNGLSNKTRVIYAKMNTTLMTTIMERSTTDHPSSLDRVHLMSHSTTASRSPTPSGHVDNHAQ